MNCINCGSTIDENTLFCTNCGMPQDSLIKQVMSGDQHAFELLYNYSCQNVYWTIHSMANLNEDTIYDLMQDSYLKAYQSLPQLKESVAFNSWMKRIAQNETLDYLRKDSKNRAVFFSDMTSDDSDVEEYDLKDESVESNPEASMEYKDRSRLLNEILDTIPEEQRVVLSMYYMQEMSTREIAEELGISENTVKSRMSYGRKKVEKSVLDLEKKGVSLLGLSAMGFFTWLLTGISSEASEKIPDSVLQGAQQGILQAASSSASIGEGFAGEKAAESVEKMAAGAAGKEAARAAGKAGIARIAAAVLAVAVVGTGAGVIIYNAVSGNKNSEQTEIVIETEAKSHETETVTEAETESESETEETDIDVSSSMPENDQIVAKIGDKFYDSLEVAVQEVKDGETIILQRDVTLDSDIYSMNNVNYTLDLNKHELQDYKDTESDFSKTYQLYIEEGSLDIQNGYLGASITISENASAVLTLLEGGEEYSPWINVDEGGVLTIEDGSYFVLTNNGITTIENGTFYGYIGNGGTLTIQDVKVFTTDKTHQPCLDNIGIATIENGEFENSDDEVIRNWEGGILKISDGTFTSTYDDEDFICDVVSNERGASLTITGGTFIKPESSSGGAIIFNGNGGDIRLDNVSLTIEGGTFINLNTSELSDGIAINDHTDFKMSGGTIEVYGPQCSALNLYTKTISATITGGTLYSENYYAVYIPAPSTEFEREGGDISTGNSSLSSAIRYKDLK